MSPICILVDRQPFDDDDDDDDYDDDDDDNRLRTIDLFSCRLSRTIIRLSSPKIIHDMKFSVQCRSVAIKGSVQSENEAAGYRNQLQERDNG